MEVDALRHPDIMRFLTELAGAAARALVRPHNTLAPPGSNGEPRLPECQRYLALVEREFSCQVSLLAAEASVWLQFMTAAYAFQSGLLQPCVVCSSMIRRITVSYMGIATKAVIIADCFPLFCILCLAAGSGQHRLVVGHPTWCGLLPAARHSAAVHAHPQRVPGAPALHGACA